VIKSLHKYFFYLAVFALPINLGLHFVFNWSYLNGLLVDYLLPVIYVQDILVLLTLLSWLLTVKKEDLINLFNHKITPLVVLFVASIAFSIINSSLINISIYLFLKSSLYALFFFYIISTFDIKRDFVLFSKVLAVSVFLVCLLAVGQWVNQGSVFNNYLFFGEQPYSFSTYGVIRENLLGQTKIPVYGTFRHPNTFAGFLVITLFLLLGLVPEKKFNTAVFGLGSLVLLFTFSYFAVSVFVIGFAFIYFIKKWGRSGYLFSLFIVLVISTGLLFLPYIRSYNTSISRRSDLLSAVYSSISRNILVGTGVGTAVISAPDLNFVQPVHNVFVLLLKEGGITLVMLFGGIIWVCALTAFYYKKPLFFVVLLQIVLLSSFDHYFWTMQQTQLLFWLTCGIVCTYNLRQ